MTSGQHRKRQSVASRCRQGANAIVLTSPNSTSTSAVFVLSIKSCDWRVLMKPINLGHREVICGSSSRLP